MRVPVALLAVIALGAAGCGNGGARATSTHEDAAPYTLRATAACLRAKGATVSKVRPSDARLRAFRDLAQRNSIQARTNRGVAALAFVSTQRDADLLAEVLRVPDDTYRIIIRRNGVVFARRSASAPLATALACLRS